MSDLIIIGAGPCGITAAIYAIRNKLKTMILSKDIGGQMAWSGVIENYSGYSSLTGPELTKKFEEHARSLGDNIVLEGVKNISKKGSNFVVETDKNSYETKAVLLASGKNPKKLRVPGEAEYINRGVVFCATCDGPLFANKRVAIVGGANSALDAALQLTNIAQQVYIINKNSHMKGDALLYEKVASLPNVEFIYNAMTTSIEGDRVVRKIVYEQDGIEKSIDVDGVFVQIGLVPNAQFIDWIEKNDYGEVIVDRNNNTSVEGIFAAGDVTEISEKQIIIAAGDGSKAALEAFKYISKKT